MIDVHPPHHGSITRRDFFIHLFTVVLGILIAIGLEQTVEYVHHRELARVAREQLLRERADDDRSNELNIFTTQRHEQDLRRDLTILQAVRNHAPLPSGPFIVRRFRYLYAEDTWIKVHQTGTVNYLTENLGPPAYRYTNQDAFVSRAAESAEALSHAAAVLRTADDAPQITWEKQTAEAKFGNVVADHRATLSESELQQGYADFVEHADLTKLTPTQIDGLEQAIKNALNDDDAELASCFNIRREIQNKSNAF